MKRLLGLVLGLVATAGFAQTSDPSAAQDGDFGARLLISDDPESFWAQWAKPGVPQMSTTSRIARERPVETIIVFHDCVPAADGNCNVTVHFEITGPDGHAYDKPQDAVAWKHPPAPGHNLLASEASFGFRLEPKDKLGRYVINATLTDKVSGKSLSLREMVTAVSSLSSPPPTT